MNWSCSTVHSVKKKKKGNIDLTNTFLSTAETTIEKFCACYESVKYKQQHTFQIHIFGRSYTENCEKHQQVLIFLKRWLNLFLIPNFISGDWSSISLTLKEAKWRRILITWDCCFWLHFMQWNTTLKLAWENRGNAERRVFACQDDAPSSLTSIHSYWYGISLSLEEARHFVFLCHFISIW